LGVGDWEQEAGRLRRGPEEVEGARMIGLLGCHPFLGDQRGPRKGWHPCGQWLHFPPEGLGCQT
jgi:hypothetical protein